MDEITELLIILLRESCTDKGSSHSSCGALGGGLMVGLKNKANASETTGKRERAVDIEAKGNSTQQSPEALETAAVVLNFPSSSSSCGGPQP